jgi:hypothetical protein
MTESRELPRFEDLGPMPYGLEPAYENDGIRPLHRVLFQQFLRPFRALARAVRR